MMLPLSTAVIVLSLLHISSYAYLTAAPRRLCLGMAPLKSAGGSDMLVRPDDEDSPEFREYLKQLLNMQRVRASSGFSAPSSSSADAYISKLNRLKVERLRLRELGYEDLELDTSYKPEDYKMAIVEASEPLVSAAPLAAGGRGNKARPITNEERAIQEAAEKNVEDYLRRQQNTAASVPLIDHPAPAAPSTIQLPRGYPSPQGQPRPAPAGSDLIDKLLSKSGLEAFRNISPTPAPAPTPVAAKQATTASTAPDQQTTKTPSTISLSPPRPAPTMSQPSNSAKIIGPSFQPRDLPTAHMEDLAKALELLVKHRGGGPFGSGRLSGEDAEALKNALTKATSILVEDTLAAKPLDPEAAALPQKKKYQGGPEEEVAKLPQLPKIQKTSATATTSAAPQIPKRIVSPATPLAPQAPEQQVPIAVGLDKFLQNPRAASIEELDGLRDALIQCLYLVQSQIASRTTSGPSVLSAPPSRSEDVTLRMLEQQQAATIVSQETASADPLAKDIRVTLAMLLKHRGGPGFGHGRLDGTELKIMGEKLRALASDLKDEAALATTSN